MNVSTVMPLMAKKVANSFFTVVFLIMRSFAPPPSSNEEISRPPIWLTGSGMRPRSSQCSDVADGHSLRAALVSPLSTSSARERMRAEASPIWLWFWVP